MHFRGKHFGLLLSLLSSGPIRPIYEFDLRFIKGYTLFASESSRKFSSNFRSFWVEYGKLEKSLVQLEHMNEKAHHNREERFLQT